MEGLTLLGALELIAATDRVGRESGDDLRAALGAVAVSGLAAPAARGERTQWVGAARHELAELADAVAARNRDEVCHRWARIRMLLRTHG